jgi:Lon protease-like protein
MSDDKGAPEESPTGSERRHNLELRERLDQILDLARQLYREASQMSSDELEQARERIEWLAQEIWEAAVYGPLEQRTRSAPDDTGEDESGE